MLGPDWTGFYVGLQAGAAWLSESLHETTAFVPPLTGHVSLNPTDFVGGGHVGYNWQIGNWVLGPEFDIEGLSGSTKSNCLIENFGAGNTAPGGCFPNALNGNYAYTTKLDWDSSLRARLGYVWGNTLLYGIGGLALGEFQSTVSQIGASQTFKHFAPGWTAGAGLEYAFTPNWHARLEYSYADYGTFSTGVVQNGGAFWNGYNNHYRVTDNALRLGVSYLFSAPPPPPPARVATPAPPPAAPVVFVVFFDWDKDTITPDGLAIVQQAAAAYKSGAAVQIRVTGYTDRSGSPGYNQRLSERRANNVAKALAALGVPREEMIVSGRGENDNRVPTADGVREPRNRRVEIVKP